MPSRKTPFVNNQFYHVFNRGVAQIPIFNEKRDYQRFTKTLLYYQILGPKPKFSHFHPESNILDTSRRIVEMICYCLMPNHFHFLLQQTLDNGITEFVSKLSNSFTKYFNTKYNRVGPLLQGEFKSVHIETNEQLLHLSRYIHLNPLVGFVTKTLDNYQWSSYPEYAGEIKDNFCLKEIILGQFKSKEDYIQFVQDQEDYGKKLEMIKHELLDYPRVPS